MRELEGLVALVLAAVALAAVARRVGAPYPVFLALGGALLAFLPGAPVVHRPSRARAGALRRPGAARRGLRRVAAGSQGQLGAGHRPGRLRGRPDDHRRCRGRPRAGARDAMGAGDCARRHRRAARRRGRNRRAPPAATAASHPDHPRRREPAERRQRAADLPPRRRRRCRRTAFPSARWRRRSCSRWPAAWSSVRRSPGSSCG